MISVDDDGEFTFTIFDLIKELSKLDMYELDIWTTGTELPFNFDESWDIHFISESIRFRRDNRIKYISLDTIVAFDVTVVKERE